MKLAYLSAHSLLITYGEEPSFGFQITHLWRQPGLRALERPLGRGCVHTPCTSAAWGFWEPPRDPPAWGFMSDQPLTASDGWVGIIHGKGVGRCGMVAGGGGPESRVHATPLGTSGQASPGPLLPPVTTVKWEWRFMSAPKSSVWMQTRLVQLPASPLTCYRTSL